MSPYWDRHRTDDPPATAETTLSPGCRDWLAALAEEGPAMDYAAEILAALGDRIPHEQPVTMLCECGQKVKHAQWCRAVLRVVKVCDKEISWS